MTIGVSAHKRPETLWEDSSPTCKLNPKPFLTAGRVRGGGEGAALGPLGLGFTAGKDLAILGGDLSEE